MLSSVKVPWVNKLLNCTVVAVLLRGTICMLVDNDYCNDSKGIVKLVESIPTTSSVVSGNFKVN